MGTGPEVTSGYDLALTELDDGFVVRSGSPAGARLAARLGLPPATDEQRGRRPRRRRCRAGSDRRSGPDGRAARPADGSLDSPRWAEIAERCLACANCTLVCPTCFCTSVSRVSDLDGVESTAERDLGQLLHARLRAGGRRQLPAAHAGPLPPVADPQVRRPGRTSSGSSAASAAAAASPGARSGIDVREELWRSAPPPVPMPRPRRRPSSPPPPALPDAVRALPVSTRRRVVDAWRRPHAEPSSRATPRDPRHVDAPPRGRRPGAPRAAGPGQFVMVGAAGIRRSRRSRSRGSGPTVSS